VYPQVDRPVPGRGVDDVVVDRVEPAGRAAHVADRANRTGDAPEIHGGQVPGLLGLALLGRQASARLETVDQVDAVTALDHPVAGQEPSVVVVDGEVIGLDRAVDGGIPQDVLPGGCGQRVPREKVDPAIRLGGARPRVATADLVTQGVGPHGPRGRRRGLFSRVAEEKRQLVVRV
jgi:hypothetical protein